MIRRCDHHDPLVGDGDKRCGQTFDDVDHSVICPHDFIPPAAERTATACAQAGHPIAVGSSCPCGTRHL